MKMKWIALLLALLFCLGGLASCIVILPPEGEPQAVGTVESETEPTRSMPSVLSFTLSEETVAEFEAALQSLRRVFLDSQTSDEEREQALTAAEDLQGFIVGQTQVAEILFYCNVEDASLSEQYTWAMEVYTETYEDLMTFSRELYLSESTGKTLYFEDWTEEEIRAMLGYSEEQTELEQTISRLLVDYEQLSEEEFHARAPEIYLELIPLRNRLAQLNGYDTYWDYATEVVYGRDYGRAELEQMRTYVKRYLVPLCDDALKSFQAKYAVLSADQQELMWNIISEDYDSFGTDYVSAYVGVFSEEARAEMLSMLDGERSIFTDADSAMSGAFTAYLYGAEIPFCYFGPGYQGSYTVVHELGHYYSMLCNGGMASQYDLSEIHSQGNEILFNAFLAEAIDPAVSEALDAYQLFDGLSVIVVGMILDEFEASCYAGGVSSAAELDRILSEVAQDYGGLDYIGSHLTDMRSYWKYAAVDSSVYYVSYSVSMLSALQLRGVADRSMEAGIEAYLRLSDFSDLEEEPSLFALLELAGLKAPTEESLYVLYASMIKD